MTLWLVLLYNLPQSLHTLLQQIMARIILPIHFHNLFFKNSSLYFFYLIPIQFCLVYQTPHSISKIFPRNLHTIIQLYGILFFMLYMYKILREKYIGWLNLYWNCVVVSLGIFVYNRNRGYLGKETGCESNNIWVRHHLGQAGSSFLIALHSVGLLGIVLGK